MGLLFICSPDLTMACMGCRASLRSRNLCYQGARQPANKSSNKRRWENKRLIKNTPRAKWTLPGGPQHYVRFGKQVLGQHFAIDLYCILWPLCLWRQGYRAVKILFEKNWHWGLWSGLLGRDYTSFLWDTQCWPTPWRRHTCPGFSPPGQAD